MLDITLYDDGLNILLQVGDGAVDHGYWGRPENMPGDMWRPAYKVDYGNPGSDIASNVASAFATGYIIFKDICGGTNIFTT